MNHIATPDACRMSSCQGMQPFALALFGMPALMHCGQPGPHPVCGARGRTFAAARHRRCDPALVWSDVDAIAQLCRCHQPSSYAGTVAVYRGPFFYSTASAMFLMHQNKLTVHMRCLLKRL